MHAWHSAGWQGPVWRHGHLRPQQKVCTRCGPPDLSCQTLLTAPKGPVLQWQGADHLMGQDFQARGEHEFCFPKWEWQAKWEGADHLMGQDFPTRGKETSYFQDENGRT
eukprot:1161810-Pelagomonas_calceolata.AAC.10